VTKNKDIITVANIGAFKPIPLTLKLNILLAWNTSIPSKNTLLKEVENATALIVSKSFCLNIKTDIRLKIIFATSAIIIELLTTFDFSFD